MTNVELYKKIKAQQFEKTAMLSCVYCGEEIDKEAGYISKIKKFVTAPIRRIIILKKINEQKQQLAKSYKILNGQKQILETVLKRNRQIAKSNILKPPLNGMTKEMNKIENKIERLNKKRKKLLGF
jgi:response regulator RpfG family c-di-GMP phosphodiesterase